MPDPTGPFDRSLLAPRRARAARAPATFLLERVAEEMAERLDLVSRRFSRAADIGTPGHALRQALAGRLDTLLAVRPQGAPGPADLVADEEALPLRDGAFDLVVSALALHFVNDLPGALVQMRRALRPDGLMLVAFAGGETLFELRDALAAAEADLLGGVAPHIGPFVDLREAGALLQRAGFALPVADMDRITVRYPTPLMLMHDLRAMAATNILRERHRPLRRDVLARAMEIYATRHADADGRLRASFDILWLSGWAPHESQQKPLKPGSAQVSLRDVLGKGTRPDAPPHINETSD